MPTARAYPLVDGRRVPRALHPVAWWVWALCLAVAASRTTNPLLLLLVLGVIGFVVGRRRTDAPWARAFGYYLLLALVVIVLRIAFRTVFGSGAVPGDHVLVRLPQVPMPHWYAGVQVGGPVSLEGTFAAAVDGLRLGTLLCCIGAANALANPRRALRVLPGALYELGAAVVVAVTVAPQLVESVQRVRRARRLRAGRTRGPRALGAIAIPVLADAFERSLSLAAAMDSRGYGRTGPAGSSSRRGSAALMTAGLLGFVAAAYGLLDASAPRHLGLPALVVGAACSAAGLLLGGRRVRRSTYRPDPWRWPEWAVTGSALAGVTLLYATASDQAAALAPSFQPLAFPPLPLVPVVAILLAAVAGVAAPPPYRPRSPVPQRVPSLPEPVREPVPS